MKTLFGLLFSLFFYYSHSQLLPLKEFKFNNVVQIEEDILKYGFRKMYNKEDSLWIESNYTKIMNDDSVKFIIAKNKKTGVLTKVLFLSDECNFKNYKKQILSEGYKGEKKLGNVLGGSMVTYKRNENDSIVVYYILDMVANKNSYRIYF